MCELAMCEKMVEEELSKKDKKKKKKRKRKNQMLNRGVSVIKILYYNFKNDTICL